MPSCSPNSIGGLAGFVSFLAYSLYIISILRKKTRPSRSTWWILTLVGSIIFWSSYALGATESFWIQSAYIIGPLIIALLSIKYGDGKKFSHLDKICFTGAIISCILWIAFNSPLIGLIGSIIVDFFGLLPTIKKAFLRPEKENPSAWLLETTASILNAYAITSWFSLDHKDWIYALYLLIINGGLTLLLWRKRIVKFFR